MPKRLYQQFFLGASNHPTILHVEIKAKAACMDSKMHFIYLYWNVTRSYKLYQTKYKKFSNSVNHLTEKTEELLLKFKFTIKFTTAFMIEIFPRIGIHGLKTRFLHLIHLYALNNVFNVNPTPLNNSEFEGQTALGHN